MRVLVTGATGFIGRAIAAALRRHGHEVVGASRSGAHGLRVDFASVPGRDWWLPHLAEVDAVINTVGIIREHGSQTFDALHARAPVELFRACAVAEVPVVIQVSSLGADDTARTEYHLSKKRADDALRGLGLRGAIVQPSLVYGPGGESAALFNRMAAAPLLPLPAGGRMEVQPVHVDDLVDGILQLLDTPPRQMATVAFVGPQPLALATYLAQLRAALGLRGTLRVLPVPAGLFRATASLAGHLPGSLLDRDTADMLLAGNAAPAADFERLLERPPREVRRFVPRGDANALSTRAVLSLWLPVLRWAIALVWLWTGIVSLGLYPVDDSYALLARVGLHGAMATLALYGAAVLDLALGLLTAFAPARWRCRVWEGQLLLMAGYTVLITLFLPEQWLHPYGPLSKNLPMAAAIGLLWALDAREDTAG